LITTLHKLAHTRSDGARLIQTTRADAVFQHAEESTESDAENEKGDHTSPLSDTDIGSNKSKMSS
jgi:hypothetical protein